MKKYLFKSKKLFFFNLLFVIINAFFNTTFAYVIKELIDVSISKNLDKFVKVAFVALIYIILITSSSYLREIYLGKIINSSLTSLKNDLFNKIMSRKKLDFSEENTANYISLLSNDIDMIKAGYFLNIFLIIEAIISFIFALIGIISINNHIVIAILILNIIPIFIPYILGNKLAQLKLNYSSKFSNFTKITKDFFSGFEVIQNFNMKNKIYKKYELINNDLETSRYECLKFNSKMNLVTDIFTFSSHFILICVGTYSIIKGNITVGTFVAAMQLIDYINGPIMNITHIIGMFQSVKLICNKIDNILDEPSIDNDGIEKNDFITSIEFKNVSFSYNKEKLTLDNVSFTIGKNKKYAIVGKSGCGKSTILKLLLKYYDSYEGSILIDGIKNADISSKSLFKLFSIIQQDVFMFDSTIKDNITLYEDYSQEQLQAVFTRSGLYNFINSLSDKELTMIGENGNNLSGGEKQRIGIGRALIKNTPILLLDEATASLDNETSYKIEKEILELDNITSIVVTHKLSKELLKKYDEILVFNQGKLVEKGSFYELISNKNYFYNFYYLDENNEFQAIS